MLDRWTRGCAPASSICVVSNSALGGLLDMAKLAATATGCEGEDDSCIDAST